MAAIITDDFRRNSTAFLLKDITDQNTGVTDDGINDSGSDYEYFIGIGKSDAWDNDALGNDETNQNFSTPLPSGSVIESKEVIDNLVGAIAVDTTEAYNIIPRVDWSVSRRYKRWNENDPTMFDVSTIGTNTVYPCYAIYDNKIYICLDNNSNDGFSAGVYTPGLSMSAPKTVSGGVATNRTPEGPFGDGYIWAYCADLSPSSKFNTDQFVSISSTATGTATDATTASGGMVYGFEILNPGSGITVTNTTRNFKLLLNNNDNTTTEIDLTIDNTGSGSSAAGIVMEDYSTADQFKLNTNTTIRASVVPAAGTNATVLPVIRPLVAPILGFGYTPTADLPAFYAGLAVNYNGDVKGELPTDISYRQISLLRNPIRIEDDTSAAAIAAAAVGDGVYGVKEVYNTLRKFQFNAGETLSGISSGDIITQDGVAAGTIAAKAFVDYVDDTNDCVYFHQNESSLINQQEFTATGDLTIGSTSFTGYTSIVDPEYTPYSGEVYFLENRKPIRRAAAQEEEIKLVIQF